MTASHAANQSARPLNPDTGNPMPSPSPAQLALVDELLDRLDATGLDYPAAAVQAILADAVVRQHGRTMRACIAQLREHAQLRDDNARYALGFMPAAPTPVDGDALTRAHRSGIEAAALRSVRLRGDRA